MRTKSRRQQQLAREKSAQQGRRTSTLTHLPVLNAGVRYERMQRLANVSLPLPTSPQVPQDDFDALMATSNADEFWSEAKRRGLTD